MAAYSEPTSYGDYAVDDYGNDIDVGDIANIALLAGVAVLGFFGFLWLERRIVEKKDDYYNGDEILEYVMKNNDYVVENNDQLESMWRYIKQHDHDDEIKKNRKILKKNAKALHKIYKKLNMGDDDMDDDDDDDDDCPVPDSALVAEKRHYYVTPFGLSSDDAQKFCEELFPGGRLAEPVTETQATAIVDYFAGTDKSKDLLVGFQIDSDLKVTRRSDGEEFDLDDLSDIFGLDDEDFDAETERDEGKTYCISIEPEGTTGEGTDDESTNDGPEFDIKECDAENDDYRGICEVVCEH